MTLEETIKYHKTVAEELGQEAEQIGDEDYIHAKYYRKCAHEHEQLAEWLTDYKRLLEEQRPTGEWIRKEDVIHSIAKQYSEHNELVPTWLSIGDKKGGEEE
jgi:hypothetical protein